ncbi:MAG: hypothetical protein NVSMB58_30300 [Terriglobales bacterium]
MHLQVTDDLILTAAILSLARATLAKAGTAKTSPVFWTLAFLPKLLKHKFYR